MSQLKPNDTAPNFELLNQNEKTISLSDFKGQKVLIYFYPKANTPGCTTQSCAVSESLPNFKKLNIVAIGISPDTPAKQKKFDEKYSLNFDLLCDTDHNVAQAYGVWGIKKMYGKEYEGIIRSSFLIDEQGKLISVWYKVSPADTVPNAMKELK